MTGRETKATGRPTWIGAAELEQLRLQWRDAGQKIWDEGTRTGRQVLAQTGAELEALGRAEFEAETGKRHHDQLVARSARGVVVTGPHALRPGSAVDPGPGRLLVEWATGTGPRARELGPETAFSREFTQAPSVQGHLKDYVAAWRAQPGGLTGAYVSPPEKRAVFGVDAFVNDLEAGNGASHFVGSWGVRGSKRDDHIDWEADNDTDATSFFYGRPFRQRGLPAVPSYSRPWPGGRTHQVIRFSTDLQGVPRRTAP